MPRLIKDKDHFSEHYKSVLEHSLTGSAITNFDPFVQADIEAINQAVNIPVYDLVDRGGKKWRPLLGLMFAECFGRNIDDA